MSTNNRLSGIFRRQASTTVGNVDAGARNGEAGENPLPPTPKSISTLRDQLKRGVIHEPSALSAIMDLIRHSDAIDDRKLFLEHALSFVSKMEPGPLATAAKNKIIKLLYNDLTHPASTSIGPKHAWRSADGSGNNPDLPDMGKAGTPYSRSVQQTHPLPKNQLPDAGLVFDTLLKRERFVNHPAGLSSLMFAFATNVIHSVFRTSHYDVNINETSSYVDLAPLYGHNQHVQEKVRAYNGLGYLHPDTFGEDRLLLLPPAVCTILVLFNRNHNYIAKKLFEINERGTFTDPALLTPEKIAAQDEEIFQIARLINAGWFAAVVFGDYFSCILGLVRYGSNWSLTPFDEIRNEDHSFFERGKGNCVSAEFNCLYRWHSTLSQRDEQSITEAFHKVFGDNVDLQNVTPTQFTAAARRMMATQQDHTQWTFGGLERQPDGTFRNEDLAGVLQAATDAPAATFGARGVPASMRLNEIMGIEQSRRWGVCSLNDFRTFLGLKPFTTFLEWNSNPEIAFAAEKLYGDIQYLELYVGLQAEEAKPLVEGAGLCPGYTVSRAILADAIALTRGDRFFTHDFTPYNLTAWGFADCQRDPDAFGFGSTMGRLILRHLPDHYSENSVYAFFPFVTPEVMATNLNKLGVAGQYDINRPEPRSQVHTFNDYNAVATILKSQEDFEAPYKEHVSRVLSGPGFYPVEDEKSQKAVIAALTGSPNLVDSIGRYFYETTQKLIVENSFTLVGGNTFGVDIARHVFRTLPVYWAATDLAGIQLKTKENPGGEYTPQELFEILSDIYNFVFLDVDPAKVRVVQYRVEPKIRDLLRLINIHLGYGNRLTVAGIIGTVSSLFSRSKRNAEHHEIVKRLYELGHSTDRVANTILAIMVSSVHLSLILTNTLNLYLGSDKDATLKKLAASKDPQPFIGFVYEALRLDPPFRGVYRVSTKDQTLGGQILKQGDRVFADTCAANLSDKVFAQPSVVNTSRPTSDYLFGDGALRFLGETLTIKITAEVLRAIYAYNNIRRGAGQSGVLKRFVDHDHPQYQFSYLDQKQLPSAWPTLFTIQYDA